MSSRTPIESLPMEQRTARVVRAATLRRGADGDLIREFTDDRTPVDEILEAEFLGILARYHAGEELHAEELEVIDSALMESGLRGTGPQSAGTAGEARAARRFLEFCFAGRPDPGQWLRNLCALAQVFAPDLILHMTGEDLAIIFGETRAANSARLKMLDAYGRAPGAKGSGQRRAARAAAQGNRSREIGTPPRTRVSVLGAALNPES